MIEIILIVIGLTLIQIMRILRRLNDNIARGIIAHFYGKGIREKS